MKKDSIYTLILQANEEYSKNKRSEEFIQIEQNVLTNYSSKEIYMFARYVEGCDINAIGQLLLSKAPLQVCYFFARYVQNVTPIPFMKKAIKKADQEMFIKFYNLALGTKYEGEAEKLKESFATVKDIKDPSKTKRKSSNRPSDLISEANKEYHWFGRSSKFKEFENIALKNEVPTEIILFAKEVEGINLKAFEEVLIMHGDPFNCMVACRDIPNINRELMLEAVKFMIYDYSKLNAEKEQVEPELKSYSKQKRSLKKEQENLRSKLDDLVDKMLIEGNVPKSQIQDINTRLSRCKQEINHCDARIKELSNSQYKMLVNESCRNIRDIMRSYTR